jgi:hypothetical protein
MINIAVVADGVAAVGFAAVVAAAVAHPSQGSLQLQGAPVMPADCLKGHVTSGKRRYGTVRTRGRGTDVKRRKWWRWS